MQKKFWSLFVGGLVLGWAALFIFIRNPALEGEILTESIEVNVEGLKKDTYFLSEMKPNRSADNPESLLAAESYVMGRLKEMGYEWTLQDVSGNEGQIFHNIIFRYGKSDSKEVIVIGAHLDAAETENPGADDNASGVAGLLELARLLKEHRPKLETPIEFVVYSLEEPPYFGSEGMGSSYHADGLHNKGLNVKYAMSLEMIGYFSDKPFTQFFPFGILYLFFPNKGNFIAVIGSLNEREFVREVKKTMNANSDVEAYSLNAPSFVEGVDYSDHRNYWKHDWPAVMITDTSFYRNKAYHTPQDTADRLDYVRMGEVVRGVYAFVTRSRMID